MNYEWTKEQKELRDAIAPLFDKEAVLDLENQEEESWSTINNTMRRYMRLLADKGYLEAGMEGCTKGGFFGLVCAQEFLAEQSSSLFLSLEYSSRLFGSLIAMSGSDELKEKYLSQLAKGIGIGAVAINEAETEDGSWSTTATCDGDYCVLTGEKPFVTNALTADFCAVAGLLEGKPAIFIFDAGQDGIRVGDRIRTLGYRGLVVAPVKFNQMRIHKSHVIGPFENTAVLDHLKATEDFILALASQGVAARAFNAAKLHAQTYKRGGRAIIKYQEVGHHLAEMMTLLQASQFMIYRAAWMIENRDPEASVLVDCAKIFSADTAEQVASGAMQILASKGYQQGNAVERAYRDAKFGGLAGTTTERARMAVADALIERYRI